MQQRRGLAVVHAEGAVALDEDAAEGRAVLDHGGLAGIHCQLLGRDVGVGVGDPAGGVGLGLHLDKGPAEEVLAVVRVDVPLPVHQRDHVVHGLLVLGQLLVQHPRRIDLAGDDVLVDRVHVGIPLGLIGQHGGRRVDDARGGVPAGAQLDAIGAGEVGDTGVVVRELRDALADLLLGHVRVEAEVGVVRLAEVVVQLLGEVVALGLAQLAHPGRVLEGQVQVVEQRVLVVEEFGVHGPSAVLLHQLFAHQLRAQHLHGVAQRELLVAVIVHADIGHALVRLGRGAVLGGDGRGEPALGDGAAGHAKGEIVVRMQLQSMPGLAELPRHERREQAQDALALFKGLANDRRVLRGVLHDQVTGLPGLGQHRVQCLAGLDGQFFLRHVFSSAIDGRRTLCQQQPFCSMMLP